MDRRRPSGIPEAIDVVGADRNNLKSLDIQFPLGRITVVTGVSGSGKSSLLADTLAAEGSRRTRSFLGMSQRSLEREDLTAFVGTLPPTVLVGQHGFRPSVRTTVATATGLLAVLRKLFLLGSEPFSERLNAPVSPPTAAIYASWIAAHYRGDAEIWAVPVRQKATNGVKAVEQMERHGVADLRIYSETDPPRMAGKGKELAIGQFKPLNPAVTHTIEALIATLKVDGPSARADLHVALEQAFAAGQGSVVVMLPQHSDPALAGPYGPRLDSSRHWVHPEGAEIFYGPSVHLLSFNSPAHPESGACPTCSGTGRVRRLRTDILVAHPERPMSNGAFSLWTLKNYKYLNIQHETISGLDGVCGFSPETPWQDLSAAAQHLILDGAGEDLIQGRDAAGRKSGKPRPFKGFRAAILEKAVGSGRMAEQLSPFVEDGPCADCDGTRWSFQARALRVAAMGIADVLALPLAEVEALTNAGASWIAAIPKDLRGLTAALHQHAQALVLSGLGYLTGSRGMLEVSGGESRRVRLARVIAAGEAGFCLLFDEPARGLHDADLPRVAEGFSRLRGRHTIILNEHRQLLWGLADSFVEIGPGSGTAGGEIVYCGLPGSRPAPHQQPVRQILPPASPGKHLVIRGAEIHNLRGIDCSLPLGRLTCICGVSGSGKSSFVRGILAPAVVADRPPPEDFAVQDRGRWRSVRGLDEVKAVVALDQVAPSPNRRSLVATMIGAMDPIRRSFAASPVAKRQRLSASDFGINGGGGRCEVCQGLGTGEDLRLESPCPACGGGRFGRAVLSVRIGGYDIRELLDTPVQALLDEAESFGIPTRLLAAMADLGIGYLALGRRIDTLSGGELQRLRLAVRLGSSREAGTLFILDEPAAGLHHQDVRVLISALDRIVDEGRNSLIVVDHDLDLIRQSDWVLEFGPGAGPEGGRIVFEGPPAQLAEADTPTGLALRGKIKIRPGSHSLPKEDHAPVSLRERAERTSGLLRTLISGEAPSEELPSKGIATPVVPLEGRLWEGRDSWEVGGLDLEVPKLLLDFERMHLLERTSDLLSTWERSPGAWLAIHPLLSDLATWGRDIPRANRAAAARRMALEGLRLVNPRGRAVEENEPVSTIRATGDRFAPAAGDPEERERTLCEALAVGAGHAELWGQGGELLGTAGPRLVDLKLGLAGPMKALSADFSRHELRGRCPACAGTRAVSRVDDALLIASPKLPPHEAGFLTREAEEIMRGVRRASLIPFLRRMEKEGLWDMSEAFDGLRPSRRELLLHGFWSRTSHGSFLKAPAEDPSEVSSWLRWDGLHATIIGEADRSKHQGWVRELKKSVKNVRCPACRGTGLRPHAALLAVGDEPFPSWACSVPPERKLELLRGLKPRTARQKETYRRLMWCLEPLARNMEAPEVLERCVRVFTTMEPAYLTTEPPSA